jgi:ATP-binding cassette subfamily G (WHITE) protein 1
MVTISEAQKVGSARPVTTGVSLSFMDLGYEVVLPKSRGAPQTTKAVLAGISGSCEPGRLCAIMGPSGAGKTSLLDILAGRKAQSSGEVLLGGMSVSPWHIRRCATYVEQDDAILPSQTVREAVSMAALLTLPRGMPLEEKHRKAEEVLRTFHLEGCADTLVGDPVGKVKGVSGGERKRCAVAMGAVREPRLLFLDEPTSGLDVFKAHTLVSVLRGLAASQGSTVACTIHQPSSDIFGLFDDLILLLGGGVVFAGPASEAVHHFAALGFECPQYANPADFFFMHVLTSSEGGTVDEERRIALMDGWSQRCPAGAPCGLAKMVPAVDAVAAPVQVGAAPLLQFQVLLKRGMRDLTRNGMRGRAQIAQSLVLGLVISLIWFQVSSDQKGVQDRTGVLFFLCNTSVMSSMMGVLNSFGAERGAVLREQANGLYGILPYFLSRVLCDLPMKVLCPSLQGTLVYWLVGLQATPEKFALFILTLVFTSLAGNALGLTVASAFHDFNVASAVSPLIMMPLMFLSGFVVNIESIPVWLGWIQWLSPAKYAFASLTQIEFTGLDLQCAQSEFREVHTPEGEALRLCMYTSGDDVLANLNIQDFLSIENCILLLMTLSCALTYLAYLGLLATSNKVRSKSHVTNAKHVSVPKDAVPKDAEQVPV